jgi:hypothetical protein
MRFSASKPATRVVMQAINATIGRFRRMGDFGQKKTNAGKRWF